MIPGRWRRDALVLAALNAGLGTLAAWLGPLSGLRWSSGLLVASSALSAFLVGLLDARARRQELSRPARAGLAAVTLPVTLAALGLVLPYDLGPSRGGLFWGLLGVGGILHLAVTYFTLASGARTLLIRLEIERLEAERASRRPPPLLTAARRSPSEPDGNAKQDRLSAQT